MNNEQVPANTSRIKIASIIAAAVIVAVVAMVGIVQIVKNAVAEPARVDYLHLENQRKIANLSLEAYDPMVEDFTTHYNTSFKEGFSADEQRSIKARYDKQFDDELKVTNDRLHAMDGAIALKDESVKAKYQQFNQDYRRMVDYVTLSRSTATQVVEVISGTCSKVTKINASGDYAKRFVDESQVCIDKLTEAKKHVTPSAKAMMASLQKMYKTQQDAFKKAVDEKNEMQQVALKSAALLGMLGINNQLAQIQQEYSAAETKDSEAAESALNTSSEALHAALEQAAGQTQSGKV